MIGDSPADLRTLVLGKQRQLEVEAAKLSKLSKTSKEEKLWLSSKIMELEEALRNVRGTEQVEQELEVARQDVSKLQEMASESEQKVHRLQREIERERAEAEEMKSVLLRRVSEAISEPRSEKPARQFGGTRWVINRSEGKNCVFHKNLFSPFSGLSSLVHVAVLQRLYYWSLRLYVFFFKKKSHFSFFKLSFFKGAYFNGHLFLDEQIPFISSAIDYAPESCVGSMFMSITAIFMFMIIAIRWRLNTDALDAVNLASLTSSVNWKKRKFFSFFFLRKKIRVFSCREFIIDLMGLGFLLERRAPFASLGLGLFRNTISGKVISRLERVSLVLCCFIC